jgi:hypothetical protein
MKPITTQDIIREFGRINFTHVNDMEAPCGPLTYEYCFAVEKMAKRYEEMLAVLQTVKDSLEVYASKSNWYDRTKNNRVEFHDGSDQNLGYDSADEALESIRKVLE